MLDESQGFAGTRRDADCPEGLGGRIEGGPSAGEESRGIRPSHGAGIILAGIRVGGIPHGEAAVARSTVQNWRGLDELRILWRTGYPRLERPVTVR